MKKILALTCCLACIALVVLVGLADRAPHMTTGTAAAVSSSVPAVESSVSGEAAPVFQVAWNNCRSEVFTGYSVHDCINGCDARGCVYRSYDMATNTCYCSDLL